MQKAIEYKNAKISYQKVGNGFPIILIHGYCSDSGVWDFFVESLKEKYLLIVPDLPGYGKSESIQNEISMGDYTDIIHQIIEKEQIKQVHLIGHSMGGYIGLELLEQYSEKLKTLTLLNSHCYTDNDEKTTNRRKTIDFLKKHGSSFYVKEIYKTLFDKDFYQKNMVVIEQLKKSAFEYSVHTLIQSCEAMINRKNHTETLKSSIIPIQFIMGEKDYLIPVEDFISQTTLPKIASIHIVKNQGHMGMIEQKETSLTHLQDFF